MVNYKKILVLLLVLLPALVFSQQKYALVIGNGNYSNVTKLTNPVNDANAPAAKACKDYRGGGKSDWFLPSKDELNALYENREWAENMQKKWYWSSSQYYDSNYLAWGQGLKDGDQYLGSKYNYSGVRAIRAF